MKKGKIIATMCVAVAVLLLPFTVASSAEERQIVAIAAPPVYREDFERFESGEKWQRQAIYLENCEGEVVSGAAAVHGEKSLQITADTAGGWSGASLKYGTVPMKNSRYLVSFDFRSRNVTAVNVEVRKNYYGSAADNFWFEYGANVQNDANGNSVSASRRLGNLGNINAGESTCSAKDGIVTVTMDFSVGEAYAYFDIWYCSEPGKTGVLVLDDVTVRDRNAQGNTATVLYASDFESEQTEKSVSSVTPFVSVNSRLDWADVDAIDGNGIAYSGDYHMSNGDNVYVGGLSPSQIVTASDTEYWYEFDIAFSEVKYFVMTTLDDNGNGPTYSEITYAEGEWTVTASGGVYRFSAVNRGGYWHVSYFRRTSAYGKDVHRFFATGTAGKSSKICIDNFMLAHITEGESA